MAKEPAFAWTAEMDRRLGTMPDAAIAKMIGRTENVPRDRRVKLGIPAYRSTRSPKQIQCRNCGATMRRKPHAMKRSKRLFCSTACAAAGQKRRDTDMLRYGPGWKNRRSQIRARDKACRSCGKSPEANGGALHVHHLKPFRYGGSNLPSNLVALCESCHHTIEAVTTSTLESIQIDVRLDGSFLMISVDGASRWRGSVRGAGDQPPNG